MFHFKKKIHYCVKVFKNNNNNNKTPKLLILSNIRLNNDVDSVNKLNELEELLVSTCLTFIQI
jgi:hypothetical protein